MRLEAAITWIRAASAGARFYIAASRFKSALLEQRYRPDQPRVPAGNSEGGQWTDGDRTNESRVDVALAGRLIDQRMGHAGGRWIRMCTYIDFLGRQYSREIDATELCPTYYVAPPHFGYS
jgi:hypothetical protein